MKSNKKKFHFEVLSIHNSRMYDQLIYEQHLTSTNLKEIEFDDCILRGYFAKKKRTKYFIGESIVQSLPVKLTNNTEELIYKDDVIKHPLSVIEFRITPEQTFDSFRNMIDDFVPFSHTKPRQWLLLKLISIMSYVSRIYVCIASKSEFGKSSMFEVVHAITDKCPVFKPRSVPGVLNKINGTGNMVFDDVLESKKEVRDIMEEFNLQIAGGKSIYINGAMKSSKTKDKYTCNNQSITYLFNNLDYYKDPNKYFENMFDNNKAIDTRFLKLKMDGKLKQTFDTDFDLIEEADKNKDYYVKVAKYLLWLQQLKARNKYKVRYHVNNSLALTGRKKRIYDTICWGIDMYCESQKEYNELVKELEQCIGDYDNMVYHDKVFVKEEYIKGD